MSTSTAPRDLEVVRKRLVRPVCVLIPAYGAADVLRVCLTSLAKHLPANCSVFVLDDATPDDSIRPVCEEFVNGCLDLSYIRNSENLGFVQTCNQGFDNCWKGGSDLLLLNSDTEVTAGFLEEMQEVLHLHERHAAVTPRSNNATIFSVPWQGDRVSPQESFAVWTKMRPHLARYQVVPTAVGFCMLIKGEIIEEFGLFDPIYSPGYNEENDFVCRINRCGYSAVAANHAFVFHHESSSFGSRRKSLDRARRAILIKRYPEYDRKVSDYIAYDTDPIENFAELYLPHQPRVLIDLSHLPGKHCGTSEFALNLLRELNPIAQTGAYDVYLGVGRVQWFFQNELRGYRIYDYTAGVPMLFDLVFKPCQIFSWQDFARMNSLAPRLAFTLLDVIAVRCDYLNSADRPILFRNTARLSDLVFSISRFSESDYNALFASGVPMRAIHLATTFSPKHRREGGEEYVLVVGNSYAHKGVDAALSQLQDQFPLLVLGSFSGTPHPNVRCLESGFVNRRKMWELFAGAKAIVYPSYYEGFGLPVVDALALGTPVIARNSEVNREIAAGIDASNLFLFSSTKELPGLVRAVFDSRPAEPPDTVRRWSDTAQEYDASFRELLGREIDVPKLRERTALMRLLQSQGLKLG